ncbi:MAG: 30S ribosomal protein S4 [Candidatus Paceibacterota bacterium]|jgi:small subunit ribosomal protein S4
MRPIKEKKERSLGVKLFLKAERCNSPKCVTVRRPQRPGQHGAKRQRNISDFGKQLQEKQKIRIFFGLNNKQLGKLFETLTKEQIAARLRERLDFVVYLLGFAKSPRIARQLVSHGHIVVNGRKTNIASFHVKKGDVIQVRTESKDSKIFEGTKEYLKNLEVPKWLTVDINELKGECVAPSSTEEYQFPFDINLVGQFYSR